MWNILGPFINNYLGKSNTGDTTGNKGQCVGLIEVWLDTLHRKHIPGNAGDLLANAPAEGYTVTENTPTNFPKAGDIVCWNGSWGGGYGHTAVVLAADEVSLLVFEQNEPDGSPPAIGLHTYGGVAGWIVLA